MEEAAAVVCVCGTNFYVIVAEKPTSTEFHDDSGSINKVEFLAAHLVLAYAGPKEQALGLVDKSRIECQIYRGLSGFRASVKYISSYIAALLRDVDTQSDGGSPFKSLETLVVGFDRCYIAPSLYRTHPLGRYSEWPFDALGRNSNKMLEFLRKNYTKTSRRETIKLAIRALLEVVESGGKNIQVGIAEKDRYILLPDAEFDTVLAEIKVEKAAAVKERVILSGGKNIQVATAKENQYSLLPEAEVDEIEAEKATDVK